jgi:hypothetical protein
MHVRGMCNLVFVMFFRVGKNPSKIENKHARVTTRGMGEGFHFSASILMERLL